MKPATIIHHDDCALHDTGGYHPERPERTKAIVDALKASPLNACLKWKEAQPAPFAALDAVHDAAYVRQVEEACLRGESVLDRGDTQVSEESFAVARLAAGAAMMAVDVVMQENMPAFSVMRPPGHHAERAEAMGFCLFNNVAIAARHAQQAYQLQRVAIIDIDVHHGNGTQAAFYDDASVFFVSFHQYPFYPGSGMQHEVGNGAGKGHTLNIPLLAGATFSEYQDAWERSVFQALTQFAPELVLMSTGFDAHVDDPLANMMLTDDDYFTFTRMIKNFAMQSCEGRIASILEGGYNLKALSRASIRHVGALCDGE